MAQTSEDQFMRKVKGNMKGVSGSAAYDSNVVASRVIPACQVDTITETRVEYDQKEDSKFKADQAEKVRYSL